MEKKEMFKGWKITNNSHYSNDFIKDTVSEQIFAKGISKGKHAIPIIGHDDGKDVLIAKIAVIFPEKTILAMNHSETNLQRNFYASNIKTAI